MGRKQINKQYLRNKPQNVLFFRRAVDEIVPKVYAGFVLALHARGMSFEEIVAALQDTQDHWMHDSSIVATCLEITGIDVMSEASAKEQSAEGDAVI